MKVKIDIERCVGDRICEETCPDIFKVNDETDKSEVIKTDYDKEDEECILEAVENCPTDAINIE